MMNGKSIFYLIDGKEKTNNIFLLTLLEFFTSVLADSFPLEFEWQQVS